MHDARPVEYRVLSGGTAALGMGPAGPCGEKHRHFTRPPVQPTPSTAAPSNLPATRNPDALPAGVSNLELPGGAADVSIGAPPFTSATSLHRP